MTACPRRSSVRGRSRSTPYCASISTFRVARVLCGQSLAGRERLLSIFSVQPVRAESKRQANTSTEARLPLGGSATPAEPIFQRSTLLISTRLGAKPPERDCVGLVRQSQPSLGDVVGCVGEQRHHTGQRRRPHVDKVNGCGRLCRAQGGIRTTILINGGAAVALLSQASQLAGRGIAREVMFAMLLWCGGVFLGAVSWVVAFISTRFVDKSEREHVRYLRHADIFMTIGLFSVLASAVAFLSGCAIIALGFGRAF